MPNNFAFNMVAQDMKTLIYGLNGTTPVAIAVDAQGNLDIGVSFTSSNTTVGSIAAGDTGTTLVLNSSEKSLYSYYVKNTSTDATIRVKLQVSPTTTASYYTDDTPTFVDIACGAAAVIIPKYYLAYTRLYYQNIDATYDATFVAYYDARQ